MSILAKSNERNVSETILATRRGHTATLLADGRVLVVGGTGVPISAPVRRRVFMAADPTARIFHPQTAAWSAAELAGPGLVDHQAVLSRDGCLLVTGGQERYYRRGATSYALLYQADAGKWLPAAPMLTPRIFHAAFALPDGNAMVVGGYCNSARGHHGPPARPPTEIFERRTNKWSAAPSDQTHGHWLWLLTALLDGDSRVFVLGMRELGMYGMMPELMMLAFHPESGHWELRAVPPLHVMGFPHLTGGDRLVALGTLRGYLDSRVMVCVYDADRDRWSEPVAVHGLPGPPRSIAPLTDRELLACGSHGTPLHMASPPTPTVFRVDPLSGVASPVAPMVHRRAGASVSRLADGRFLAVGGESTMLSVDAAPLAAEIYDPEADRWTPADE